MSVFFLITKKKENSLKAVNKPNKSNKWGTWEKEMDSFHKPLNLSLNPARS